MSITAKGKKWEILHSLWIGWTFTLLFYWVAFLYIGFRTKQKKWVLWGLGYAVSLLLLDIATRVNTLGSWQSNVAIILWILLILMSIVHAFIARKEYLLRLEALQRQKPHGGTSLKRRLAAEYGTGFPEEASSSNSISSPLVVDATMPDRGQKEIADRPTDAVSPSTLAATTPQRNISKRTLASSGDTEAATLPQIWSGSELDYRISSAYPFPLAFGFRSLASVVDHRDLYREQLRVAENMLAFIGSIALSLLEEEDRGEAEIDPKEYWLTGISPGDWKDIVARCSRVLAKYEDNSLASDLKKLNIRSEKKGFGSDVAALIRVKNDYKHDRGPVVLEDIADASKETQERLRRCMEALAFLTAHPIRQVEDFDVGRRGGGVILKCLRYTGDHPSFPQEEVAFDRALPRGDLFLEPSQQDWVPLFPFITTMTCSHCKARETYFIDSWDIRRGTARMKSFERGHTMLNEEVAEALLEWSNNARPAAS